MINDMADFLMMCFKDGSFSKVEARNIVNSPKFNFMDSIETDHEAEKLFDAYIEEIYLEKVNIVEKACKIFLEEVEKLEETK